MRVYNNAILPPEIGAVCTLGEYVQILLSQVTKSQFCVKCKLSLRKIFPRLQFMLAKEREVNKNYTILRSAVCQTIAHQV